MNCQFFRSTRARVLGALCVVLSFLIAVISMQYHYIVYRSPCDVNCPPTIIPFCPTPPPTPPPDAAPPKPEIFAAFLGSTANLDVCLYWAQQMLANEYRHQTMLIMPPEMFTKYAHIFRPLGMEVLRGKSVSNPYAQIPHTFSKLAAWDLLDYARILLMDCSVIPLAHNLDCVFEYPIHPGTVAFADEGTDVILLQPNNEDYLNFARMFATFKDVRDVDAFLQGLFAANKTLLPIHLRPSDHISALTTPIWVPELYPAFPVYPHCRADPGDCGMLAYTKATPVWSQNAFRYLTDSVVVFPCGE